MSLSSFNIFHKKAILKKNKKKKLLLFQTGNLNFLISPLGNPKSDLDCEAMPFLCLINDISYMRFISILAAEVKDTISI